MKWKITFAVLGAVLIIIQFINSKLPETAPSTNDNLFIAENVPGDIQSVLSRACYDCHSMETKYPWYSYVAPVKWLLKNDINEGRGEMNFSEWGRMVDVDKVEKLGDISEVVKDKEMPLKKYLVMHPEARLSLEERQKIITWADSTAESYFE